MVIFDVIKFHFNRFFKFRFSSSIFLPTLFLALIFSRRSSKDVVSEEILFSCSMSFDENLLFSSLGTLVYSERQNVSGLILTSPFPILLNSSCFFLSTAPVLFCVIRILDNI